MNKAFNPYPFTFKEICKHYGWTEIQLRSVLEKNYIKEIIDDQIEYEQGEDD